MIRQNIKSFRQHVWPSLNSPENVTPPRVSTFTSVVDKPNLNKFQQIKLSSLVLFQLIDCLSQLQERGIDHVHRLDLVLCNYTVIQNSSVSSNNVKNTKDVDDTLHVRLLPHLQTNEPGKLTCKNENVDCKNGDDEYVSLDQCINDAIQSMPIPPQISALLQRLLKSDEEKVTLLLNLKVILGLWLWGPPSDVITSPITDRPKIIQHWLDLERAKVLHKLLMSYHSPNALNVHDWSHASFLAQIDNTTIINLLASIRDYRTILNEALE